MKSFDWNRFRLTLCYDFATGRRQLLRNMMYMLLAYVFVFFVFHLFHPDVTDMLPPEQRVEAAQMRLSTIAQMVGGLSTVMAGVFALVTVSGMFGGEQTKQGRIRMLMLPASNVEKFLSRWLLMAAVTLGGTVVAFPLADALHMLYCSLADQPVVAATPRVWSNVCHTVFSGYTDSHYPLLSTLASTLGWLSLHAFFLLGATLFRKHQFLLTASSLAILLSLFASGANWLDHLSTDAVEQVSTNHLLDLLAYTAFHLLIVCVCCWLAYRLFCRWQVITRKFVNL